MSWASWIEADLQRVRDAGQWRTTRPFDALGPTGMLPDRSEPVVSFASNDYLGLSFHPAVIAAAQEAAADMGTGSTASRLIVGSRSLHAELEDEIAEWKHAEAALVFATGYQANVGLLSTLGAGGGDDTVTVFSDELNHASIIDGCRLSRAATRVYRHVDLVHLRELLAGTGGRKLVVTDAVFSMDGDVAPVADLQCLCGDHDALLVIDEAHSVLGPDLVSSDGVIRTGTLSKTLGSLGGWVAGPRPVIDLLVNRARSFIFTTALTPPDTAAALAALRLVRSDEGERLVDRLRDVVDVVVSGHPSPIVPIVIGDEAVAVDVAAGLLERGVLVPAIRPPTVAPGTSRLRVALSAAHTDDDLDLLTSALDDCWPAWRKQG